jgi:hypothetical protein
MQHQQQDGDAAERAHGYQEFVAVVLCHELTAGHLVSTRTYRSDAHQRHGDHAAERGHSRQEFVAAFLGQESRW